MQWIRAGEPGVPSLLATPPAVATVAAALDLFERRRVEGAISVTTVEDLGHRRQAVWRSVAALIGPLLALAPTAAAAISPRWPAPAFRS